MRAILKAGRGVLAALLATAALGVPAYANPGPPPTPAAVPEVDPGAAAGALTLLVGGVLTLADRRRAR